jgi:hypothetical protein
MHPYLLSVRGAGGRHNNADLAPTAGQGMFHDEAPMTIYITRYEAKPAHDRLQHGEGITVKILLWLALTSWWAPAVLNGADSYSREIEAQKVYELTGTLTELDLARGKGMMRTDHGKPVLLEVKKPELLKNLSVGDRLTIEMTEDGQVDKVMGVKVPELAITGQPVPPQP